MSVRRLDPVQPEAFAFTPDNLAWAQATIAKYPPGKEASAVIPVLWRAQEQNAGWVSRPAMEYVANLLGMAYIRVYEIATFYTMFQLSPVGTKAHVQVCGTTPCMLRGAGDLIEVCRRKIAHEPHELSADGSFSWEEVECLGACVNAPMVQVWKDTYEDLTPESLEKVLDAFARGEHPKPGPQNGRQFSAPEGGATTLTAKPSLAKPKPAPVEAKAPTPTVGQPTPATPTPPGLTREPVVTGKPEVVKPAPAKPAAEPVVSKKPATALPIVAEPPALPVVKEQPPLPVVKETAPLPVVVEAPAVKPAVKKPAKTVAKKPAKAPAKKAAAEAKPELLKKPRAGKGDDLKLIWGVGPGLEKLLHEMGVWHFDQIAAWTPAELKWIDDRLEGFKGRAKRDEWVKQAKKLAKGWRPDNAIGEKVK